MKAPALVLASLAALTLPSIAAAQSPGAPPPGYGPAPMPPAVSTIERRGLTAGFGFGFGGMESNDGPIECIDCNDSVAGSFDGHIGVMLTPRFAVGLEVWGSGQALDSAADASLVQVLVMGSAQWWATPRLWVKGGLGSAHLSMRFSDETRDELANGAAGMVAVGYELVHRPRFAMDVQLKGGVGNYEGFGDRISQGTLQLGFRFF